MKVGMIAALLTVFMLFGTFAHAGSAVGVNGDLILSGTGTISFPNGSVQTTANTDCNARYEDNGDGTVTDCRTGLIWLKNANCIDIIGGIAPTNGYLHWTDAKSWVAGLYGDGSGSTICSLNDGSSAGDWRLPTKTEWMAMVQSARKHGYTNPSLTNAAGTGHWTAGDIFNNVHGFGYWSGIGSGTLNVWVVNMSNGHMDFYNNFDDWGYAWPVRSGR